MHPGDLGNGPDARLFRLAETDASVLTVEAEPVPASHPDAFDLARLTALASVLTDGEGRELVLITEAHRQIQLDVRSGTLLSGPVCLHFHVAGFLKLDAQTKTLLRLNALQRLGRFPTSLFPSETMARKWARALQAYDGIMAGASQRDIACILLSEKLVQEEWNGRSDFLRLRIQRLLAYGRKMVGGGWRTLLD